MNTVYKKVIKPNFLAEFRAKIQFTGMGSAYTIYDGRQMEFEPMIGLYYGKTIWRKELILDVEFPEYTYILGTEHE